MSHNFVGSDLHSGHLVGLTPPDWQTHDPSNAKYGDIQSQLWDRFVNWLKQYGPYDNAFWVGDLIEGTGSRSGGTELISTDRTKQCRMAAAAMKQVPLKRNGKHYIVKGTPYHTGEAEEYEDIIADILEGTAKVEDHGYYEIDGHIVDLKHHIGSSSIPHGRSTPLKREALWAREWHIEHGFPLPDVVIRAHVHYFDPVGGAEWVGCTLPALQGLGSKYGKKRCSGVVHFGFVDLDLKKGERPRIEPHIALGTQKPEVIKI